MSSIFGDSPNSCILYKLLLFKEAGCKLAHCCQNSWLFLIPPFEVSVPDSNVRESIENAGSGLPGKRGNEDLPASDMDCHL